MGRWTGELGRWVRSALSAWGYVRHIGHVRMERAVRAGASPIAGRGLFALRSFEAGHAIGPLRLGRARAQGKHTLQVGARHRTVEAPWRYINHACRPSARLEITKRDAVLIATCAIAAGQELTIDYRALPETPSVAFTCHCGECDRVGRTLAG